MIKGRRKKFFYLILQKTRGILWDPIHNTQILIPNSHGLSPHLLDKKGYDCHILLDTVDQDFFNEKIPPLSYFDRRRFLKTSLKCRFDDKTIGRAVLRKTKKGLFLTGWSLLERDAVLPWIDELKRNALSVSPIKSLPIQWGRRSRGLPHGPTLYLTLSKDWVLRQWYYEDRHCAFGRAISFENGVLSDEDIRDAVTHEIHLSLSYLMRRGIDVSDLRVIVQSSIADRLYFPAHLSGIHSMIFKETTGFFHEMLDVSLCHQTKDSLAYRFPVNTNELSYNRLKKLAWHGLLGILLLALLAGGWHAIESIRSLYLDNQTIHQITDQIAHREQQLALKKNPLSNGMISFLQTSWQAQSFFWTDGERLSHFLDTSLKGKGYIHDYIWTHDPSKGTTTAAMIVVVPADDYQDDYIAAELKQYFPNALIAIQPDDSNPQPSLQSNPTKHIRVELTFNREPL